MKKRIWLTVGIWIAGAVFIGCGGVQNIFIGNGEDVRVVQAGKTTSKDIQKKIDETNRQMELAEEEKKKLENDIKALEKKKGNVVEYIETLDEKLSELSDKIQKNEDSISKLEVQIEELKKEKQEAEEAKEKQYDTMTRRIKYMYENGKEGYLEILLEAGSLSELFNRVEYVNRVTAYDKNMLLNYQKICDQIQRMQDRMDEKLSELTERKKSLKVEKESVDSLMTKKSQQLEEYQSAIEDKNDAVDSAEDLIRKQEEELEALLEAQRKKIAEEAKAREEAEKKKNTTNNNPSNSNNISDGAYLWPLASSGRISSYFGYRTAPTAGASSFHKGIDIAVPVGTRVLATNAGTVVTSAYSASAGNYVAIYHGDGIYSYYMHCSSLSVSEGEKVSKGQQVALSGNTGISTGPHLHFAIYANGAYVDPLGYVSQ